MAALPFTAETTVTTGTDDFELAGSVDEMREFSDGLSDGDPVEYACYFYNGAALEWEEGEGNYVASTNKIARTTIFASSNAGAKVSFSAGSKTVLSTPLASRWNAPAKGHIFGLNSSNAADADHDQTFTAGGAASDDAVPVLISLASAFTKQADATFAEGTAAGAMVSGESLPTSGTIHWWLIGKADGTADICCNNHASSGLSPTLPSGFIYKRRIHSDITDGSANIVPTSRNGDDVDFDAPQIALNGTISTSSAATVVLPVPVGVIVDAKCNGYIQHASIATLYDISSLDQAAITPSGAAFTARSAGTSDLGLFAKAVRTNTAASVRSWASQSSTVILMNVNGYRDPRGRFS